MCIVLEYIVRRDISCLLCGVLFIKVLCNSSKGCCSAFKNVIVGSCMGCGSALKEWGEIMRLYFLYADAYVCNC